MVAPVVVAAGLIVYFSILHIETNLAVYVWLYGWRVLQNETCMYISNLVLAATAILTALVAGLFYAYSCSVSPGLGRLPDAGYLSAMQSINRAIQNPVFFISFLGCLILLPLSTYLHYSSPVTLRF